MLLFLRFDYDNNEYKSLFLYNINCDIWNEPELNPALLNVDNNCDAFYESCDKSLYISSYFNNWIIYNYVIFVTKLSKFDIIRHNLRNPLSYDYEPIYFNIFISSSYFYWLFSDYFNHFFNVEIYDFCNELYPVLIFLSLSN